MDRLWWWFRGLGSNGQRMMGLCQRCGRRGVEHFGLGSVFRCARFAPWKLQLPRLLVPSTVRAPVIWNRERR